MTFTQVSFRILLGFLLLSNCQEKQTDNMVLEGDHYITVLGVAQDAGYPQINCNKECCKLVYEGKEEKKRVSSIGLIDNLTHEKWLFDATPDIALQTQDLKENHVDNGKLIDGVFLTHAHIGHYTGLMYLGREALGGKQIPVYAMPKMTSFLKDNGPWNQLLTLENIELRALQNDSTIMLNSNLKVTPFLVPHRDEFSETVGYKIEGQHKSALFIPDINKWQDWKKNIVEEVKQVDYAFLDATFFKDGEIPRPMSEVPHPFITETVDLFKEESKATKNKIIFIHFNHSNPAIIETHELQDQMTDLGFRFAKRGQNYPL